MEHDTGLRENDLRAAMMNRDFWKYITVWELIKRISKYICLKASKINDSIFKNILEITNLYNNISSF